MTDLTSPRSRFGMLFVGVARRWRATLDASLAELGLSDASWAPLMHVERAGGDGVSQKELARRVGLDGSSLVRLIDALVAKGFVERRQDPSDRRFNLISVTEAGAALIARIETALSDVEGRLLADLDDGELAAMTAAFERIDARIRAVKSGERRGA